MSSSSKKQKLDTTVDSTGDPSKPLPLQRRRVWRACESCRRKKIKCDGREPTCGQCVTSRTSCTWIQTKDRAALSRHYVQELEQRLLHMESLLAKVVGGQSQDEPTKHSAGDRSQSSSLSPHNIQSPSISSPPLQMNGGTSQQESIESVSTKVKQEDQDDVQIRDQLGQLALDDHGHLRWIGSSSTMSLIQSFRALTSESDDRYSPSDDLFGADSMGNMLYFPPGLGFGKVRALPGPQEVEYPDRDLADKLVAAYFDHLHFQLPVVHKPTFLKQYEELMDMSVSERADAGFVSVLFGVFACAARIVDDKRLILESGDGGMAMVYYERAMILYYIGHSNTQLAQVQCFVVLASFLCSVNCLPQAWLIVGQAVRIGQDLGLHRTPKHLPLTPIEKQIRRKVWWSVYTLDRMLAIALGRPLGIDDRDCDAEFPIQVDDDHLQPFLDNTLAPQTSPSPMVGFVALSALFKIGGDVLRRIYSVKNSGVSDIDMQIAIDDLDAQLTDWCERLPPAFKYLPSNEQQTRIGSTLASSYYAILITLHRRSLSPRRMNRSPAASNNSSAPKAVQSARACIRLAPSAKDVIPPSHHLAFFIQFLSTSAVIVLLFAMHAPDDSTAHTAMGEVQSSLKTLQALEGRWPGARKCIELLDGLVEVARGVMRHDNRQGSHMPPSTSIYMHISSPNNSIANPQRSPPLSREDSSRLSKLANLKRTRQYNADESPPQQHDNITPFVPTTLIIPESGTDSASFYHASHPSSRTTSYPSGAPEYLSNASGPTVWPTASGYPEVATVQQSSPGPSVDPRFLTYSPQAPSKGPVAYSPGPASAGSTPPLPPPFDTTGLPFAGLDFLHNFTPAGYSDRGDQSIEALWQNIGAGAFNFDPELHFSLDERSRNGTNAST
ncbi:hypothetical protein K439DRAFT_1400441 [Ramaria rubella]|nr:hypothetical protein K439DRAFT_1400441 [Ramaria rubella]